MAKAFQFEMEFLINLRQRKEEEAMTRLAKRLASINDLEIEISANTELKSRLSTELSEKIKTGNINIPLLTLYKEYDVKLDKDLARLNQFLYLSRREEVKERAELTRTSIDLKVIEKLKENRKKDFVTHQMHVEQNHLEEMATLAKACREREVRRQESAEAKL